MYFIHIGPIQEYLRKGEKEKKKKLISAFSGSIIPEM
jgi:hypothetical protein